MKKLIVAIILTLVSGCGGGNSGETTPTDAPVITVPTQTVKKTSIVDGTWIILSDGSWRGGPMPADIWADPIGLAAYDWLKFEDGKVIANSSGGSYYSGPQKSDNSLKWKPAKKGAGNEREKTQKLYQSA